jgi:hypothetical protein
LLLASQEDNISASLDNVHACAFILHAKIAAHTVAESFAIFHFVSVVTVCISGFSLGVFVHSVPCSNKGFGVFCAIFFIN